uniref:hypothetical protein n=1 Tax=Chitinimonas sp. TaxID=1934313 RepID=UPI0035B281EB
MAWPTQFFHSLRFRLLAASITIELLLLSLLLGNSIRLIDASMRASIDVSLQQNVTLLNVATAPYLLQGDYATLTDNLTEIIGAAREDGIVYAVVLDNDGRTAAFAGPIEPSRLPAPQASLDQALRDTVLHVVKPARLANRTVGELHFGLSTLRMAQARRDVIQQGLLIAGFVVFASLIL